jgi:hypothetical protein
MTTRARQLLQKFENLCGAAWVASEGGRMSESGVEKRFAELDYCRKELVEYIESIEGQSDKADALYRSGYKHGLAVGQEQNILNGGPLKEED